MPGITISWWWREPAYLSWGDRAVVNKLLVGRLSILGMSAVFPDKLGRGGISWKWGKSLKLKEVLFHMAHNYMCRCCRSLVVARGSDSFNKWLNKFMKDEKSLQKLLNKKVQLPPLVSCITICWKLRSAGEVSPSLFFLSLLSSPKVRLAIAQGCVDLDCGIKQLFCIIVKCVKCINWNQFYMVQTNTEEHYKRMT